MLGTAKKVTVSKDDTIILDGAGEKTAIEERSRAAARRHCRDDV